MTAREQIAEMDSEALIADGWDNQIIGTAWSPGRRLLVVYDGDAIIDALVTEHGMDYSDAVDYFCYNIEGAWVGERTPVYLRKLDQ